MGYARTFGSCVLAGMLATACTGQGSGIDAAALDAWLTNYGAAWESADADAAASLFTIDATYRETPYDDPFAGRDAIREYWTAVTADQADIEFDYEVVSMMDGVGTALWSARFRSISGDVPVELSGVFVLEFANAGEVSSLREWWHVR